VRAVAATDKPAAANPFKQPAGKGMGFYTGEDGYLYCDNLRVGWHPGTVSGSESEGFIAPLATEADRCLH
jgi:hypothetical protein